MGELRFVKGVLRGAPVALFVLAFLMGACVLRGWEYDVDFSGGTLIKAEFPSSPPPEPLLRAAFAKFSGVDLVAQRFANENILLLRIDAGKKREEDKTQRYCNVLTASFPGARCIYSVSLGAGIEKKTVDRSIKAAFVAAFSLAIYVCLRFGWPYGSATAAALACVAASCAGFFALTGLEISTESLLGALSGTAYAAIECVVLFNGTRNCARRHRNADFDAALNESLGANARRAALTLIAATIALGGLAVFGGRDFAGLSAVTLFAATAGTFFTFFVATPILFYAKREKNSRQKFYGGY